MKLVVLDFETYFDQEYSLSKMTQESYIRDKRFEAHGAAVKWSPNVPAKWYDEKELRFHLQQTDDWSDTGIICWHAQFDGFILSHHYNVRPRMWFCPMSMARMIIGNHISVSLDSVRKEFGLAPKITPYNAFRGLRWHEMSPEVQQQVARGAEDEVESIWNLFGQLHKRFPAEEYDTVDATVRFFTEPTLIGDTERLAKVWQAENDKKARALDELGVTAADLQSADKFAALLEAEGEEIEYKDGKSGPIPCFAKTDPYMLELQESDNPRVQALALTRLGLKSTLAQSRAETLGWMSTRGPMCVYLRYCGAHTTRWSGGDAANYQNITSGSEIDKSLLAPEGFELVKPDSAQVECRLLNYVAGQWDVVETFREGRDVYAEQATKFYGKLITKDTHPVERQTFKVVELQAGYQSGAAKIKSSLKNKGGVEVTLEVAEELKDGYRRQHPFVKDLWSQAGQMLSALYGGLEMKWGPVWIKDKKMWLPNGAMINYDTLEWHRSQDDNGQYTGDDYWRFRVRRGWRKSYGGALTENLIQALARVVISQAMIRIRKLGYRIVSMRHDDLWVLIPKDGRREQHIAAIRGEMCRTPEWALGLPLDCDLK